MLMTVFCTQHGGRGKKQLHKNLLWQARKCDGDLFVKVWLSDEFWNEVKADVH